jgi:hypothetical protein
MSAEIACLCLAGASLSSLKQSILDFESQTHEPRELLIGVPAGSRHGPSLERFARALESDRVRIVPADSAPGLARWAEADLLCAWSGEARIHPQRLELQAANLERAEARCCVFVDRLRCVPDERIAYWVGGETQPPPDAAAAGLLAAPDAFEACAAALEAGEWPAGELAPLRLSGGGALVAELREDPPPALEDCVSFDFARALRRSMAAAMEDRFLPRPLLLLTRAADGTAALLDPIRWEAT